MPERSKQLRNASLVGIYGNTFLSVIKIIAGLAGGSLAVVGDGIDSSTDILTFMITLYAARIISKPPDHKFPYGYLRAEAIAAKFLAFVIFFAGAQLLISTMRVMVKGSESDMPGMITIYVTLISIAGKSVLSWWQSRVANNTQSSMLYANARNMRNDVIISSSVLTGLIFTHILKMPLLDQVVALMVSLWVMKEGYEIFAETSLELMDGIEDTSIYDKILSSVNAVAGVTNPHRIKVRKISNMYLIALDIEADENIRLIEAHKLAEKVERELRTQIDNIYDILIHVEPAGNVEPGEKTGIDHSTISRLRNGK